MTRILTDIEGTTSSISFVKEVLFPYAAKALPAYVRAHQEEEKVAAYLERIRQQEQLADSEAVIQRCLQWIEDDVKDTALKGLQGLIWEHGYQSGAYLAHMYPDAVSQLQEWHEAGIPLYVYSSGSIYAQQLFFGYSEAGDLRYLFDDFFDTTSGPKQESRSYQQILIKMSAEPSDVLFLSDVIAELDAAATAGLRTCHVVRDENMELSSNHPNVSSFHEINKLL